MRDFDFTSQINCTNFVTQIDYKNNNNNNNNNTNRHLALEVYARGKKFS